MINFKRVSLGAYTYEADTDEELEMLYKGLTFTNENAFFMQQHYENYDGKVRYYDEKRSRVDIGIMPIATKFLDKKNIPWQLQEKFKAFIPAIPISEKLRPHQKAALEAWFKERYGIIQVPTRGGKTYLAAEAIHLVLNKFPHFPVLFIVDGESLFEQAIDDIAIYMDCDKKSIGRIKASELDIQRITVATIQTITSILHSASKPSTAKTLEARLASGKRRRLRNRILKKYLETVKFLIVDECHEYGEISRVRIIQKIKNVQFAMYLSATPFKSESPINRMNMMRISGKVVYEIPEEELKQQGYLARDLILLIYVNHRADMNITATNYREYEKQVITHNHYRNGLIVNTTEICRKLFLKVLVLFVKIAHGNYVASITRDEFLNGDSVSDDRKEKRIDFLKKKGGVLFASNIFKKGITLPEVQVMINAGGGKEKANVTQKKGRVLGVKAGLNKALIVDFIDDSEYFCEHSLNRIEEYENKVPKENIVVLDSHDNDFYHQLIDTLEDWFELA